MKLAINYSPQAEALVAEGTIGIDLFKCPPAWDRAVTEYAPDLLARASAARPIYLHFPLHAGNGSLEAVDWEQVEETLAQTGTPFVNVHLQAQSSDFPSVPIDAAAPADASQVVDSLVRDVGIAAARFGPERVIMENVAFRGADRNRLYPCVDPDVISEVVRRTGCGFLLDTAHARLTALSLGLDVQEYVARMPVAHLREIHVTGAQSDGRRFRDSMPMGREDWKLIEWVMGQVHDGRWATPWAVALEYGGVGPSFEWRSESGVIAQQAPRLRELTAA